MKSIKICVLKFVSIILLFDINKIAHLLKINSMNIKIIQLNSLSSTEKTPAQFQTRQTNLKQTILQHQKTEYQPESNINKQLVLKHQNSMYINLKAQIKAVIIISSTIWYFGFNRAMIAAVLNSQSSNQFKQLFGINFNYTVAKAILAGVAPFGSIFGTIMCSFLIKHYSSREIYFKTCIFSIIFTFMTMYTNIYILLIFRFFIGITVGMYVAITPMFIRQITAKDVAPYFGTASVTNQSLGGFMSFAIGYGLFEWTSQVRQTWIIMCTLNVIPLIVVMICIKKNIVYQSPIFLLRKHRIQEAKQIFQQIYEPQYVNSIMIQKGIEVRKFYMEQLKSNFINLKTNKMSFFRRDLAISIHLPVLRKMTGFLVIVLSSASLIKSIDPVIQREIPIINSGVYFISCFMSNILVKYFSRKTNFQIGTVSACVLNLLLSIGYYLQFDSGVVLTVKLLLIIIYGMTLGPLVWPYLPEVVPARIIPLAQTMNFAIDCLTLTLPPIILTNTGSASPLFFIFFAWDFISIIINHFLIIQTKRKTIAQIIDQINKQN